MILRRWRAGDLLWRYGGAAALGMLAGIVVGLFVAAIEINRQDYLPLGLWGAAVWQAVGHANFFAAAGALVALLSYALYKVATARWTRRRGTATRPRPRWRVVAAAAAVVGGGLLVGLNAAWGAAAYLHADERLNVLIIGIDTFRGDHLASVGYARNTMPNLEALMAESAVFTRAYAPAPWTLPSFHSILTGLYPHEHDVTNDSHRLDPAAVTLAEVLKNEGYHTAGFVAGPYLKSIFGFNQGFDIYDESLVDGSIEESHATISSPAMAEKVVSFLRKNAGSAQPFFLFTHWWDPHFDFIAPAPYSERFDASYEGPIDGTGVAEFSADPAIEGADLEHLVALYDAELAWTDEHLGRVFAELERLGLKDNTLVVVVGDHGEQFKEHGYIGHKKTLYNEEIHVPLVIHSPAWPDEAAIDAPVSTVGVFPTVLTHIGVAPPAGLDERTLQPLPTAEAAAVDRVIYAELFDRFAAVVRGDWKAILDTESASLELYNLQEDPAETRDVAAAQKMRVEEMKRLLLDWKSTEELADAQPAAVKLDAETEDQLRALGYL